MIGNTHEVKRLATRMKDEGAPTEEIEQAVNEYLMACDLEHPEVQVALFYENTRRTVEGITWNA